MNIEKNMKIIKLSTFIIVVLFLSNFIGCTSPSNMASRSSKSFVGHWVSNNGNEHIYFSDNRLIKYSNGEEIFNSPYALSSVEGPNAHKFRNIVLLEFFNRGGGKFIFQLTLSDDRKKLNMDNIQGRGISLKSVGSYDYKYVDNRQKP